MKNEKQTKIGDYIQPKQGDIFETSGKCCYTEATRAYTKIIFKNDLAEECRELKNKKGKFLYDMEFPRTDEAKKKCIKHLTKVIDTGGKWPFLLWIKEVKEELKSQ